MLGNSIVGFAHKNILLPAVPVVSLSAVVLECGVVDPKKIKKINGKQRDIIIENNSFVFETVNDTIQLP